MLNVSATQAQQRMIEKLQEENKALRKETEKIGKEMTSIKEMLFTQLNTNPLTQNQ